MINGVPWWFLTRRNDSLSCASGDTVPVTPNTLLQNFTNRMPIGTAVSTDKSPSAGTMSHDISPHPSDANTPISQPHRPSIHRLPATGNLESELGDPALQDGVTTRGMANATDPKPRERGPREKFDLTLLPRIQSTALAANTLCFILHPDSGNAIVAEGWTGGSWKSPKQKFGHLCAAGEQMVQVHKILRPGLPLPFLEERQLFSVLEHALVKPSGSSVYVKWLSNLLVKKNKSSASSKIG
ncbi:hypothetical protein KC19_VG277600 [Ceratodon purpureus]|uniref:Uncharacterized protein n=1 Tax=Ceratodon purpureus TaxID=3225 RepID=A0A8T0HUV0_CERPU|nr:hypothetical protein KC19_VG277600 [Ceratodon purpureus]